MKLTLQRLEVTDYGIFGHLTAEDGGISFVTLERHDISIPAGSFEITLYDSPEHGLVPLLKNIPGRDWIEIHEGNWEHNSKGCILVGTCRDALDKTMIDNSKVALKSLIECLKQSANNRITIS